MTKPIDVKDQRFGRLVVLDYTQQIEGLRLWICRCDCGRYTLATSCALRQGIKASCGCLKIDGLVERSTIHGHSKNGVRSPEYRTYYGMLARCHNPNIKAYHWYGARGIIVCDRWRESFTSFLSDMGERPSRHHSLHRIDNDGPYSPENCKWVERDVQSANTRAVHLLEYKGQRLPISGWARKVQVKAHTISARLGRGWTESEAIGTDLVNKGRTLHPRPPRVDLTGQRHGRLTVVEFFGRTKHQKSRWKCVCDCGTTVVAVGSEIIKGSTLSCGCLRREKSSLRMRRLGGDLSRLRWENERRSA